MEAALRNRKALVTGGAGFIGSNIVRRLVEGDWSVTVFDDLSTGYLENLESLPQDQVTLVRGDVRDADAVRAAVAGQDAVFHLAASVGNLKSIEQPRFDAETNVLGTLA